MSVVQIQKAEDDPICIRVSCGGAKNIGYYCTYRGSLAGSIDVLEKVILSLKALKGKEPAIDPRFDQIGAPKRN